MPRAKLCTNILAFVIQTAVGVFLLGGGGAFGAGGEGVGLKDVLQYEKETCSWGGP